MVKKSYNSVLFITTLFAMIALLMYQIYMTKQITQELEQIRQTRIYYIQFLNAVTVHLKKKILAL